ncbi:MAG: response regulator, partial [Candidatus Dadabacteria bacterium]|nr:response regulator [Candidatus Dadabacteria bacterium]NIQ15756.1 response regulator [Candidatus Dadabacteria bacterium]
KDDFNFIICDMKMPEMDGFTFLKEYRKTNKNTVVIMISAYGDIDSSIKAVKEGADDYISKPVKTDELILRMKMAEEKYKLKKDNQTLKRVLTKEDNFENIIFVSREMDRVKDLALKSAQYNTTVLIMGESGTGKELIAKSIHNNSKRKDGPFIAVNCSAIPDTLLESELFGYEKGAFSGATTSKKGLFELANNGTLLLDEIGDFPTQLQTKLLRFLQEGEIRKLGDTKTIKLDVRILTATNADLEADVNENKFRSDLYYRINVLQIYIPPLRERKEDIPHLINHFINIFNLKFDKNVKGFSSEALNKLLDYPWYGNVRELENTIERSVILADSDIIESVELSKFNDKSSLDLDFWFDTYTMDKAKQKVEKAYIERALDRTKGNRTKAAELLNISRRNLLYKLKEFEINN